MPHRCVKCNARFLDDDPAVRDGCGCGSRAFLFERSERTRITRLIESDGEGRYEVDLRSALSRPAEDLPRDPVLSDEEGRFDIDVEKLLSRRKGVVRSTPRRDV